MVVKALGGPRTRICLNDKGENKSRWQVSRRFLHQDGGGIRIRKARSFAQDVMHGTKKIPARFALLGRVLVTNTESVGTQFRSVGTYASVTE